MNLTSSTCSDCICYEPSTVAFTVNTQGVRAVGPPFVCDKVEKSTLHSVRIAAPPGADGIAGPAMPPLAAIKQLQRSAVSEQEAATIQRSLLVGTEATTIPGTAYQVLQLTYAYVYKCIVYRYTDTHPQDIGSVRCMNTIHMSSEQVMTAARTQLLVCINVPLDKVSAAQRLNLYVLIQHVMRHTKRLH
jgi:hypothetical protein